LPKADITFDRFHIMKILNVDFHINLTKNLRLN